MTRRLSRCTEAQEAVTRFLGVAGLQPVGANISVEQRIAVSLIDVVEGVILLSEVMVILREIRNRTQRQRRQIAGGHVVVGIRQSVDIGKMAAGETDFLGLGVHQIDESGLAAGQPLGQHDAGVVAGLDDHAAHQIVDLDARADRHEHLRPAGAPGVLADRQLVSRAWRGPASACRTRHRRSSPFDIEAVGMRSSAPLSSSTAPVSASRISAWVACATPSESHADALMARGTRQARGPGRRRGRPRLAERAGHPGPVGRPRLRDVAPRPADCLPAPFGKRLNGPHVSR